MEDVLLRAKNAFVLQEGKAVAKDDKGETIYNSQGEPLTIEEWISRLQKSAGHLFEESTGTGARGQTKVVQTPNQMSAIDKIQAGLKSK